MSFCGCQPHRAVRELVSDGQNAKSMCYNFDAHLTAKQGECPSAVALCERMRLVGTNHSLLAILPPAEEPLQYIIMHGNLLLAPNKGLSKLHLTLEE